MRLFLWLGNVPNQSGIGGDICDGTGWDESYPMSEGLWRKFADWAVAFDRTQFYSDDFETNDWDCIPESDSYIASHGNARREDR